MPQLLRGSLSKLQGLHCPSCTPPSRCPQRPRDRGSRPSHPHPTSISTRFSTTASLRSGRHGHPTGLSKTPRSLLHPPSQALSSPWSLPPQGPLSAPHSWALRGPPPGPVAPYPRGSPAPPLLLETRRPRAGKCLTTYLLQPGAGLPRAVCPSLNTTTSGAGMCFCPFLIPLLLLSVPLILFVYKTHLFGALVFLPFKTKPLLPPPLVLGINPRWHFMLLPFCWLKPQFYLLSLEGPTLLPLTCSGWACLENPFLTFVF